MLFSRWVGGGSFVLPIGLSLFLAFSFECQALIFSMNKWISIQALRGMAVLGVVAFHSMSIEKKYSGGDLFLPDFFLLGQSGVDLFFVISGFVMVSVTKGRFERDRETMRFLWGRFSRIYPTYWAYFFLTLAVYFIKPNWVNALYGHQADVLSSFFLLPNQRPLVMVAWSLSHELWFYMIFAVLLKLKERWLLPSLLVWAGIIVTANLVVTMAELPAGVRVALHPYSLEFITGALVALFLASRYATAFTSRMSLTAIIALLVVGLPFVYLFDILKAANIARVSVVGVLYGLLVLSLATLEKEKKFFVPQGLQIVGDISYTIYLSHILVLSAIGRLWALSNPLGGSLLDNVVVFLLLLAAVVSSSWIGYRLVELPLLRLSHRLRACWFDVDRG